MQILFLTDNFPPEVNAPATRTFEHARRWVAAGAEVTVITCAPNFPQGIVHRGYRNRLRTVEIIDGIRVIRVWSYMAANKGFALRTADYLSYALSATIAGLFEPADVIVATSPQFFTTFAGAALSLLKRRPWIFEVRDIWPESLVAVGATDNRKLIDFLEGIELALYRKAAQVVVVSPAFKTNLIRRGVPAEKLCTITNGVDLEVWKPRSKDTKLLRQLGIDAAFTIGYIGTHGMAHGLDFIVEQAPHLSDIHFLFIGEGAEKEELIRRAETHGVDNITFLPPVPKNEVPRYLASVDAALVPLRKSDTFKSVIPSKIFEAAALRRPILLGVEGQAERIIQESGAGICFSPEDGVSFRAAVNRMKDNPGLYASLQEGCEHLAETYSRQELADKMLEMLRNVAVS